MNATEIVPGLWMGGQLLPIADERFDAIVNCRELEDLALPFPHVSAMLWVPMIDGPELPARMVIEMSETFIRGALFYDKKTLVHCTEGRNRSGLIVAYYLIESGVEPSETVSLIRAKRPGALSNQTFVDYLLSL